MKNIFENAKFGDKFVTRKGDIAILLEHTYEMCDGKMTHWYTLSHNEHREYMDGTSKDFQITISTYHEDGKVNTYATEPWDDDIVSKYHEPIDFDKLHELANKLCPLEGFSNAEEGFIDEREDLEDSWVDGFKAGYRKAKEE